MKKPANKTTEKTTTTPAPAETAKSYKDWINETPPDPQPDPERGAYFLEMWTEGGHPGDPGQSVPISRAEFIDLKRRLAEMRGRRPPETAAADATKEQTPKVNRSFGTSPAAMFSHFMSVRDAEDRRFMTELLNLCTREPQYSVAYLAFDAVTEANSLTRWLPPADEAEEEYPILQQLYSMLAVTGWPRSFLRTLTVIHQAGNLRTPEDLFFIVDNELEEFSMKVESAGEILADHPHTVQKQIKEAIQKHPDLVS